MRAHPRATAIWHFACLALLIGCGQESTVHRPLTPVTVHTVERVSATTGTRYSVSLSPLTQVDLAFKVGGYVKDIHQVGGSDSRMRLIQAGDRVRKGAVLAQLRESDYAVKLNQAKSNEVDATANFTQAKLDFDRAQNLFATQSLTKSDYDAARARYDSAQAKLQGAVESRKEADISVQDSTLKAPLDGVILKRNIEVGALVSAGTVAFGMADTSVVKATFGVPDITVQHLTLGRTLSMTTEAIPGIEFHGQITKIDPSADPTSRVFQVEVKIANSDNALKPGMIAAVDLPGDQASAPHMAVPLSAIVRPSGGDKGYALYVVVSQNDRSIVHLRSVQLGPVLGNTVIVTEGVKPGEVIVVKGATLIVDGEQVRVLQEVG
jgi:RND family efflux transporter MFP subunit